MKILLIRLDHVGDIVLTVSPIAKAIKLRLPESRIDLLTTAAGASLLSNHPNLHQIHAFDAPWSVPPDGKRRTPRWLAAKRLVQFSIQKLRMDRYDAIAYLSFSPWDRRFTHTLAPKRVGFSGPYQDDAHQKAVRWLTHSVEFDESKHILANTYHLIDSMAPGQAGPLQTELTLDSNTRHDGMKRLKSMIDTDKPWIALHPGHPDSFKTWPLDRFQALAEDLAEKTDGNILILQSPAEVKAVQERSNPWRHEAIHVLPTRSFLEFASVVSHAQLCIANDGGPSHIASALGVPTVVLFGPTDDRIYRPLGPNTTILRPETGGRCATPWRVSPGCCDGKKCLEQITVERVSEAALPWMGR